MGTWHWPTGLQRLCPGPASFSFLAPFRLLLPLAPRGPAIALFSGYSWSICTFQSRSLHLLWPLPQCCSQCVRGAHSSPLPDFTSVTFSLRPSWVTPTEQWRPSLHTLAPLSGSPHPRGMCHTCHHFSCGLLLRQNANPLRAAVLDFLLTAHPQCL